VKLGAIFPTREMAGTPADVRQWADAVVALGFDHVVVLDHVLGVDPAGGADYAAQWPHAADFRPPYTYEDVFHEPFVLFGFLAAVCDLELVSVLVLPQRQTVLVAKQAAEVDVLSSGRLRLAVGVGWNPVEFEALGMPYHRRGRLIEEQIALLRTLWTTAVVTFEGEFHTVRSAGLQMLPIQRPIPIWMGGDAPSVLERIGRLADGWYPNAAEQPGEVFEAKLRTIGDAAEAAGRDRAELGVQPRVIVGHKTEDELQAAIEAWRASGATHLGIDTMTAGRTTVDEHIGALERTAKVLELV
jgi:probable F420-dependent oxidoreductase